MQWAGGCLCGKRRYQFEALPDAVGFCHCNMCKKAPGGPFAVLVRVSEADLQWRGAEPSTYRSSPIAVRGFCPDCGSPLFLDYDGDAYIRLTVGSLDHPELVRPQGQYGMESRLPWVDCWHDLRGEETQERF